MVVVLGLSLWQQDGPARALNGVMLLNLLITQSFKRFFFRKRPGISIPPRAERLGGKSDSSSVPSRTVVVATTFIYVALTTKSWHSHLSALNELKLYEAILYSVLMYVVVSFMRIYMGQSFPSDTVMSIVPTLLVIAAHYLFQYLIVDLIHICATCGEHDFCYVQSSPQNQSITRANYSYY